MPLIRGLRSALLACRSRKRLRLVASSEIVAKVWILDAERFYWTLG